MAFKAGTLRLKPGTPNDHMGTGQPRAAYGLQFKGRLQEYAGKPTQEMLDDDLLDVRTLSKKPWPKSAVDRLSRKGQRKMELAELDGKWPSARDLEMDAFVEAKLADPEGVAMHVLTVGQGMSEQEATKQLRRTQSTTKGVPDLSNVADAPKPTGSRKRKAKSTSTGSGGEL